MDKKFTCIIIDDELPAIGLLSESLMGLYDNIVITGTYTTWKDGLAAVRNTTADILFLDISIEGKNGMDILKIVPDLDCEIVFVTAFAEHALKAFNFAASGYVVKPIGDAELNTAVNKAMERVLHKRLARQHNNAGADTHKPSKIGIPSGKGINYYNAEDILYFEAVNNYTKVITKTGELTSSYNIGKFESMLENQPFYQIHRSYIVNLNYVTRYEAAGSVIMTNKKELPVARGSREDFLKRFSNLQSTRN